MERNEIMQSGLLELYAMGSLQGSELDLVREAIAKDPLLFQELKQIEQTLYQYARAHAIAPNPTVKLLLMARIDYMERLDKGEKPKPAPILSVHSKLEDFAAWLERKDMQAPDQFEEGFVKIIAQEPDKLTAIVWLRYGAPPETHSIDHEKFLIAEGTCDIVFGDTVKHLHPGDFLQIPLHISHHVSVTSDSPCKIILQRMKAEVISQE